MDFAAMAEEARSTQGRTALADRNLMPGLLSHLQACIDQENVPLLRLLRNMCAEDRSKTAFCENGGVELVVALACKVVKLRQTVDELDEENRVGLDVAKLLMQLLANVSWGGQDARELIWRNFFPDMFISLACVSTEEIHEPICMVLQTCTTGNSFVLQLAEGKGARLMAILLRDSKLPAGETKNQWLSLLVEKMCFKQDLFESFFTNLGPSTASEQGFSSEQVILLDMLHSLVDENPGIGAMPPASLAFLVKIIKRAATNFNSISDGTNWPTGTPVADVMGFSLLLVRALCANEEDIESGNRVSAVFGSLNLAKLCLDMLRALGPPEMVKKANSQQQLAKIDEQDEDEEAKQVEVEISRLGLDETPSSDSVFPGRNLYRGYRRDIVAVIGNMSFRNFEVQEQVRENGGLLLMLQQCVVEENNPYLREWGLWAIRNLTEGNAGNARELADLEMKKPVDTEEIRKAGLRVDINSTTGRPKLVNLESN